MFTNQILIKIGPKLAIERLLPEIKISLTFGLSFKVCIVVRAREKSM